MRTPVPAADTGGRAALAPMALCLALATGVLSACSDDSAERDAVGAVASPGAVDAFQVKQGDCLVQPELGDTEGSEVDSLKAVPCNQPHDGEAYHLFTLPDGDYPGAQRVLSTTESTCTGEFEGFVGVPAQTSSYAISYLFPTEESWSGRDDREIVCIVAAPEGEQTTGSAKDARE